MAEAITGLRVAKSYLDTPDAEASIEAPVLDFQLAESMGVQILAVLGYFNLIDRTAGAAASLDVAFTQELHREDGTLDAPLIEEGDGGPIFNSDDDIFWAQSLNRTDLEDQTNGQGGVTMAVTPSGLVTFPEPLLSARNITHRVHGSDPAYNVACTVLIYYKFVRFTMSEMGFLLSRRT